MKDCRILIRTVIVVEYTGVWGMVTIEKTSSAETKNKQTKIKPAKLYSDLCQAENRGPLVALDSQLKRGYFLHLWHPTVGDLERSTTQ